METDFVSVTEVAGDEVSEEQIERICHRYYWAGLYCTGKDVVEVACGSGQGLGYLAALAKSFEAGDISEPLLDIVRQHYGQRIKLSCFDAQQLPFADQSKDVIVLFEAIYYLPQAERFVAECARVLRPGGLVLVATANKDLYDFNPSPYTYKYYGTLELRELFAAHGFSVQLFGYKDIRQVSWRQRILRPIKALAARLHLIPETTQGKKWLKRIVFGSLKPMPREIKVGMYPYLPPDPVSENYPDQVHKVLYCLARKNDGKKEG